MRRNILDMYMILGGVPYYWKFLQREYTNLRWMTCLHFDAPCMYRTITCESFKPIGRDLQFLLNHSICYMALSLIVK